MIIDSFSHHVKNRPQQFVGRRHSGNLLASSFEHPQIVLAARSLTAVAGPGAAAPDGDGTYAYEGETVVVLR